MVETSKQRKVVLGSAWMRTHVFTHESAFDGNPKAQQKASYLYMTERLDPVIRRSVLYFDQIEWPVSSLFAEKIGGFEVLEEQGLIHHGVVEQPRRKAGPPFNPYMLSLVSQFSFEELDRSEPNTWAFAPLVEHTPWWTPEMMAGKAPPADSTAQMQGLMFELYDALPVPAPEVNYADILDFKSRRAAELAAMRAYMDQLYEEIARSRDFPHARNTVMEKLDVAINDVARTMTEGGLKGTWQSMGLELIFDLKSGAGLGVAAATAVHGDVKIGAAVGSGVGLYRFLKKNIQSPVKRAGPLAYLLRAGQEKVIELPSK